MTLVKTKETYVHSETGMRAELDNEGKITIYPSNQLMHKGFVFINSKKETVIKVASAILELASKAKSAKKTKKQK